MKDKKRIASKSVRISREQKIMEEIKDLDNWVPALSKIAKKTDTPISTTWEIWKRNEDQARAFLKESK